MEATFDEARQLSEKNTNSNPMTDKEYDQYKIAKFKKDADGRVRARGSAEDPLISPSSPPHRPRLTTEER